ncbi:MAG TPA: hypothetical protein VGZ73_04810 [Bryobacteraceae bacterium]|jgi:hypothetical protein|nr:hypothetical protein [Bryobacteraceae bacterium]
MSLKLLCALLMSAASSFGFQASDPQTILKRMLDVTGFARVSGKALHWHDMQGVEQNYQSPSPFITVLNSREVWIDPRTGIERISSQAVYPGRGPSPAAVSIVGPGGTFSIGPNGPVAVPGSPGQQRNLDLWAVLADWRDARDVRLAPSQVYQDYPRTVLARAGAFGEERLFLDTKTGFPVKLDREEPHYLWGQVRVEYLYSIWHDNAGAFLPVSSARVVDGFKEITRTVGDFEFIDRENAPDLALPAVPPAASGLPLFLQPLRPKKIDIDTHTFLTQNPGYTEAFALAGDTVYILDATQSEKRAQQDLELIRAAFPGEHRFVLVVTDLAWPHIAGVRFWVASGATVISHRASKEFLTRVVERRWTRAPDLLEQRRKSVKFHFVAVDKAYTVASGKLELAAIDGIGSEGSLMAWLPDSGFLWASDYIQSVTDPATYTTEVWLAVERAGFKPKQVAAMHIPLTPWATIEALAKAH